MSFKLYSTSSLFFNVIADSSKNRSANLMINSNFVFFVFLTFVLLSFSIDIFWIEMLSTGALLATFFSSSNVFALFATKVLLEFIVSTRT